MSSFLISSDPRAANHSGNLGMQTKKKSGTGCTAYWLETSALSHTQISPPRLRFGFLALRVGLTTLFRRLGTALIACLMWLVSRLDYARDLRGRTPAAV